MAVTPLSGTAAPTNPDASKSMPVRRIDFEESLADLPRLFAVEENLFITHLLAYLSAIFPPGESYFIQSVRAFRDQIEDPDLKRQVAAFIGQESVHSREHDRLNEQLLELGHDHRKAVAQLEWLFEKFLAHRPAKGNLAATAAVEHFTAVLGELVLRNDLADYVEHPGMRQLLQWHALEECEHKAVSFDVFQACVGDEGLRIRVMRGVRPAFLIRATYYTLKAVLKDPASRERGRLRRDFKAAKAWPLFSRDTWRELKKYDRPGFHPNDSKTEDLVQQFRAELFGQEGTLTDYLRSGATSQAV